MDQRSRWRDENRVQHGSLSRSSVEHSVFNRMSPDHLWSPIIIKRNWIIPSCIGSVTIKPWLFWYFLAGSWIRYQHRLDQASCWKSTRRICRHRDGRISSLCKVTLCSADRRLYIPLSETSHISFFNLAFFHHYFDTNSHVTWTLEHILKIF